MAQGPQTAGMMKGAVIGGVPTVSLDVPVLAVFMLLYVGGAAANMTIFQINKRNGHKFIVSVVLFGFCMSRILTCILRIVWATRPTNSDIAIAAQIFVNAGILLVYLINLIFAQRVLRAKQPTVGWHPVLRFLLKAVYVLLVGALVMVVVSVALVSTTKNPHTLKACRDIQLTAITFLLVVTALPFALLGMAYALPSSDMEEKFGKGDTNMKAIVVTASTCLAVTIAGFKAGTAWEKPRLASRPAWYHSKACFYVFNFALEVTILLIFLAAQVDKRFHVPDGCKGPGDYSGRKEETVGSEKENQDQAADAEEKNSDA